MSGTRRCPRCQRFTQVGFRFYECLCCGQTTDLRRKKRARSTSTPKEARG